VVRGCSDQEGGQAAGTTIGNITSSSRSSSSDPAPSDASIGRDTAARDAAGADGSSTKPAAGRCAEDAGRLAALFDLGLLRFQQRDQLVEAFQRFRLKVRAQQGHAACASA